MAIARMLTQSLTLFSLRAFFSRPLRDATQDATRSSIKNSATFERKKTREKLGTHIYGRVKKRGYRIKAIYMGG